MKLWIIILYMIWQKNQKYSEILQNKNNKYLLSVYRHVQKKVALCDIAKSEKSQIFVLFENEASYEDFFCPQVI